MHLEPSFHPSPLYDVTPVESPVYSVFRDGTYWWMPEDQLLATDLVENVDGNWHAATEFEALAHLFAPLPTPFDASPQEHPLWTVGKFVLGAAAVVGTAVVAFKVVQAAGDEDFGTAEYRAWFRRELIEGYVDEHGWHCTACGSKVPKGSLTVDHIVALKNGGRTSRANAQVLCLWCNSGKGAKNGLLDYLRGRA
jgi:hypothetical protein